MIEVKSDYSGYTRNSEAIRGTFQHLATFLTFLIFLNYLFIVLIYVVGNLDDRGEVEQLRLHLEF